MIRESNPNKPVSAIPRYSAVIHVPWYKQLKIDTMTTPNVCLYSRDSSYMRSVDDQGMYAEGSLALILRLCRCAGVAPLRASRAGAGWRFHVSTSLAVLQSVAMTIINVITLACIVLELNQEPDQQIHAGGRTVQTFVWVSDTVLMQVIASLAIYRGTAQMESLRRILHLLRQIKFDLSMGGPSAKTERIKSIAMVIILLWMASVMLTEFVSYLMLIRSMGDAMWTMQLFFGVRYLFDFQGMLAVVKWACTVLAVHESAAALNQHLKQLQHGSDFLTLPGNGRIRRLTLSHVRISDIMRQMSDTNGLFLISIILSTFMRFVIILYYMLFLNQVFGVMSSLNWTLVHLAVLILTIEPCHWTHTQREYTAILLGELMVQYQAPSPHRLSSELDQFAKQLMLNDTKFSAFGVYTLDRHLIAAILGGVTTYLIIIIQFQMISNI